MEPIVDIKSSSQLQLFPIQYDELWDLYMKAKAAFWTAAEIDLSKDLSDRNHCLTDNEQHIVSTILAFFTSSDAIVNENLVTRFCKEVQIPEARYFYTFQAMMENIHSEVYGLLIDTYIRKPTQRDTLFRAIDEHPTVKAKAVWALRWIKDSSSFATHLVPFAAVEGIFFSGSFTIIFWLKKWGLMPGLSFSNELIARDEGMHTLFAMTLYHTLKQPLPADTILDIVRNAVDIEKAFWDGAFKSVCLGLDADSMKQYIEYVTDYLLVGLDVPKLYNSANPFNFMELISLEGKTNLFEKCVRDYSRTFVMVNGLNTFSTDEDF